MSDNITCAVKYTATECNPCLKTIFVNFHIVDMNDVAPTLSNLVTPIQELETYQNIAVGQVIRYLQPRDDDAGINARVSLQLVSGNEEGYFRIEKSTIDPPSSPNRVLFLNKSLTGVPADSSFNLTIYLQDMGSPPLNSTQYIVIKVKTGDSTPPAFITSEFCFQVVENHPIGTQFPFGQVNVTDDPSLTVFYQFASVDIDEVILDQTFGINYLNGALYLLQSLDYDHGLQTYELRVEVRDPGSESGAYANVHIVVIDTNDEYPQFMLIQDQNVMENQNTVLLEIQFTDNDVNINDSSIGDVGVSFSYPVKYSVSKVQFANLKIIQVTLTEPLDREASPTINMTITASDGGQPALHSSAIFTIYVGDENDNAPQFSLAKFEGKVPESTVPGRSVMSVTASDPDQGVNSTFDFVITAVHPVAATDWFTISQTSGEIFVASLEGYSSLLQPVQLTVNATDHGNITMSNSTKVTISFTPPYSFAPRSFQQYAGYDMFAANTIYLEFRTGKTDALLFYEMSLDGSDFTALELIDMKLYYTQRQSSVFNVTEKLVLDMWYSVLINKSNEQVSR